MNHTLHIALWNAGTGDGVAPATVSTTPVLSSTPIPPDTAEGLVELTRLVHGGLVQNKMSEMMQVEAYLLDPRWVQILTLSANHAVG